MRTETSVRAEATACRPTVPALYDAVVTHVRQAPLANRFRYRTGYWLIDYDHPPRLPVPLRPLAGWRPGDHLDIRAILGEHGLSPARILTLAHARSFGYVFNPLSVHWCYDDAGVEIAVVAEVHNTYGGRRAYLLRPDANRWDRTDKSLYVSPFYPVDGQYQIRVSPPQERLLVTVTLHRGDEPPFVATLNACRLPATTGNLLRMSARYPWTPLRTSLLIRRQGVGLWLRGLKVVPR